MSDRFLISQMRHLLRVEAQLDKERSYRYVDTVRVAMLKKLRLQLKDRLNNLLIKGIRKGSGKKSHPSGVKRLLDPARRKVKRRNRPQFA